MDLWLVHNYSYSYKGDGMVTTIAITHFRIQMGEDWVCDSNPVVDNNSALVNLTFCANRMQMPMDSDLEKIGLMKEGDKVFLASLPCVPFQFIVCSHYKQPLIQSLIVQCHILLFFIRRIKVCILSHFSVITIELRKRKKEK